MKPHDPQHGRSDSVRVTRRAALRLAGALGLSHSVLGGVVLGRQEGAAERRPTLVTVFLRGGLDGLNLIVPHGEEAYYRLRPQLAIPRPAGDGTAVDLDGFFGLHPAAAAWKPWFDSGAAAAVHAVGTASNTRSHFEEQDRWETAVEGATLEATGWLNRYLATTGGPGPVRALALGDSLPRALRGDVTTLALRGLSDLVPRGSGRGLERTLDALERAYGSGDGADARGLLGREGRASLEALAELREVARNPPETRVAHPETELGRRARELGRLLRADVGLEVVQLDVGGWDTHQYQGGVQGAYANNVRQLADALAALLRDLQDVRDDVLVLVLSEFGRTAAQNGTGGTDHGWGNCVVALGAPLTRTNSLRAGPVVGDWPGLERDQLNQGRDLAHTSDFRGLYAEALRFLGVTEPDDVIGGDPVPGSPLRLA